MEVDWIWVIGKVRGTIEGSGEGEIPVGWNISCV